MQSLRSTIDRILAATVTLLMSALVVAVLWQVFTRFVLQDASSWTEELARFLMIWLGLLGAAYVAGSNLHLAVDLLPRALTGRRRQVLSRVIDGSILVFALVVLVGGGSRLVYVTLSLGQTSAALGLPLGVVYAVLPLSGLLMAFYVLVGPPSGTEAEAGQTQTPGSAHGSAPGQPTSPGSTREAAPGQPNSPGGTREAAPGGPANPQSGGADGVD